MTSKTLCLKIDVDTHDGMKNGVEPLLEDLAHFGIKATFCLSFGPDNSGKAIFRLFRDPRFLKKMLSTGAPKLYGLRTIVSGTILPARPIATAFPGLCKRIRDEGHEVIVHAWNHRRWQDHLQDMTKEEISNEFKKAFLAYRQILGVRPWAVAAPGWQVTETSLQVQDGLGLLYASDLRDGRPCLLKAGKKVFRTLQIPTTGPCVEELLATGIRREDDLLDAMKEGLREAEFPVLALHAEVEGGPYRPFFRRLMTALLKRYHKVVTLGELATTLLDGPSGIEVCDLSFIELPGRAGRVASGSCGGEPK